MQRNLLKFPIKHNVIVVCPATQMCLLVGENFQRIIQHIITYHTVKQTQY